MNGNYPEDNTSGHKEIPRGAIERINFFRTYKDGWYDNHRGISDEVAEAAIEVAERVGEELVFAVPFDGAIVLYRRWKGHEDSHGRQVEIQPDGFMSLSLDYGGNETRTTGIYDKPFDLEKATAWLLEDTRSTVTVSDGDET